MKYNISNATAPAMPTLGKGTECIKLLLSQVSEIMHAPLVPMFFPSLGAHISGTEFQYPDNSWKEPTGMMKGQLTPLVEAICRDFRRLLPQAARNSATITSLPVNTQQPRLIAR